MAGNNEFTLDLNLGHLVELEQKLQTGIPAVVKVDNAQVLQKIAEITKAINGLPTISLRIPNADKIETAATALAQIKALGKIDVNVKMTLPTEARMVQFVASLKEIKDIAPQINLKFDASSLQAAAQAAAVLATSLKAIHNIGAAPPPNNGVPLPSGSLTRSAPGTLSAIRKPFADPRFSDPRFGSPTRLLTQDQIDDLNRRTFESEQAVTRRSGEVNASRIFSRFGIGDSPSAVQARILEEEALRRRIPSNVLFGGKAPTTPFFNSKNVFSSEGIQNIGFSTILSGGGPAQLAGAVAGAGIFGPAAAATGALLAAQAFRTIAEALGKASEAGLSFERTITAISAILQLNSRIVGTNGQALPVGQQLKAQLGRATEIQLASRAELSKLGIGGEAEATLVQAVVSGAAQRGISLDASQTAKVSSRFGAAIQALRPELLQNTSALRRDVEDVVAGLPQANRTAAGAALRPFIGDLKNAKSGDEFVKATERLQKFVQTLNELGTASISFAKFSGAVDNFMTTVGDDLNKGLSPGLNALADSLFAAKGVTYVFGGLANTLGTVGGAALAAAGGFLHLVNFVADIPRFFVGLLGGIKLQDIANFAQGKGPSSGFTVKPNGEEVFNAVLAKSGVKHEDINKGIDSLFETNDVKLSRLQAALPGLLSADDISPEKKVFALQTLVNLRTSALDDQSKYLGELGLPGQIALASKTSSVDENNIAALISGEKSLKQSSSAVGEGRRLFGSTLKDGNINVGDLLTYGLTPSSLADNFAKDLTDFFLPNVQEDRANDESAKKDDAIKAMMAQRRQIRDQYVHKYGSHFSSELKNIDTSGELEEGGIIGLGPTADLARNRLQLQYNQEKQGLISSKQNQLSADTDFASRAPEEFKLAAENLANAAKQAENFGAKLETAGRLLELHKELLGIDQGSFAGKLAATNIQRDIDVENGTPGGVADNTATRSKINIRLAQNDANLGLLKSSEALKDAQFQQAQRTGEMSDSLAKATRSLQEFDQQTELRNLEAKSAILAQAKRVKDEGGSIPTDYAMILDNPDSEKTFTRKLDEERLRSMLDKETNRQFDETESRNSQVRNIDSTEYQQGTAGRGVRDATFAYYQNLVKFRAGNTKDNGALNNLLGSATNLEGWGNYDLSHNTNDLPPVSAKGMSIGQLSTAVQKDADSNRNDARKVLVDKLGELAKTIQSQHDHPGKNIKGALDQQETVEAVAVGTAIALNSVFS